jgi:aspartate aminotransferase
VSDAEDFCRFLLADFEEGGKTVMLTPGAGFYSTPDKGRNEVRIAYVLEQEKIRSAASLLAKALPLYQKQSR